MSKLLLFIDDEPHYMEAFVIELDLELEGFDVPLCPGVGKAREALNKRKDEVGCIILDLMMPREDYSVAETKGGFQTGVVFHDEIRNLLPDVPVIVHTNLVDSEVEERFSKSRNCTFVKKRESLPSHLAELVREIIDKTGRTRY